MFSNVIAYTGSPGGQRRGLIWQSGSGGSIKDPRNFVQWNHSSLMQSDYAPADQIKYYAADQTMHQSYVQGGTSYIGPPLVFGWKPNYIPMRPQYIIGPSGMWQVPPTYRPPYHTTYVDDGQGGTTLAIIADEDMFYADIDDYWIPHKNTLLTPDPLMSPLPGSSDMNFMGWPQQPLAAGARQIFGDQSSLAGVYDTLDRSLRVTIDPAMQGRSSIYIGANSSAPFHIKGRAWYWDYYYTLFNEQGVTWGRLDPLLYIRYIDMLMQQYTPPTQLGGAVIGSRGRGDWFSMPFPTFGSSVGEYEASSAGSTFDEWDLMDKTWVGFRFTRGAYMAGSPYEAGLYVSPAIAPLTKDSDHAIYSKTAPQSWLLQHRPWMLDEVIIDLPYYMNYPNTPGPLTQQPYYQPFSAMDTQSSVVRYSTLRTDNPASRWYDGSYGSGTNYGGKGNGLVAMGIRKGTVGQIQTVTPAAYTRQKAIDSGLVGTLNPVWRKGDHLETPLNILVARYDITHRTSYRSLPVAGRMQIAAFKGIIGFFDFDPKIN